MPTTPFASLWQPNHSMTVLMESNVQDELRGQDVIARHTTRVAACTRSLLLAQSGILALLRAAGCLPSALLRCKTRGRVQVAAAEAQRAGCLQLSLLV